MQNRPFDVDTSEYPFQSHWFDHQGSRTHYIDEGEGPVIVMCHGNPTWSYLYRHIIKALSPRYRCIAYDLPGFGFSDHPANYGYTPQEHAQRVEALLIDHLQLDKFVLVMQDWGGPIGLSIAVNHPDRVAGMILSSTFIGAPNRVGKIFSALMGSKLGQHLIYKHNLFAARLVPIFLGKSTAPATLKAYRDPFPTEESRAGTAIFPVQIVAATPWLEEIKAQLPRLTNKPVEFIFGLKDLATRKADMDNWLGIFPWAGVQKIPDANHYTQEDCPDNYVIAVERIMKHIGQPAA
jgi:haloalkane dehalogenase